MELNLGWFIWKITLKLDQTKHCPFSFDTEKRNLTFISLLLLISFQKYFEDPTYLTVYSFHTFAYLVNLFQK